MVTPTPHTYTCINIKQKTKYPNVWKRLLPKEIEDGSHGIMEYILTWCNHSIPSISGEGKSASGHLVDSIKELAFMRIRDNLPKSWPVASPSFTPLHLASAVAINLT